MTETETPETSDKKQRRKRVGIFGAIIILFLIVGSFAAYRFCPWIVSMHDGSTVATAQLEQRLAEAEQQIRTLNNRLDELSLQAGKVAASAETAPLPQETASASELAHMQSDLVALSSAVNGLQAEVKRAGTTATETQKTAQSSIASAVAFIQLRAAAEARRGFAPELSNLRTVARGDAAFREILAKLEPYAAKGAPVVNTLREEFIALEAPVSVAVRKANAQNWWQRLLAELGGLISIRPLHGGDATDVCAAAEEALSAGDLNAALDAIKALPSEAQDILKDWRGKAEARAAIDTGLRDLSDRFAALAGSPPAPQAQDQP